MTVEQIVFASWGGSSALILVSLLALGIAEWRAGEDRTAGELATALIIVALGPIGLIFMAGYAISQFDWDRKIIRGRKS